MKIWLISDTHLSHGSLKVPDNVDMVIHSGDGPDHNDPSINSNQALDFFEWFSNLPIKYKIYVPGNHDTAQEYGLVTIPENVHCLIQKYVIIEGIKIWGSPYTPRFFDWAYNVDRDKLGNYFGKIPKDVDILATHSPPKGILDLCINRASNFEIEHPGCEFLTKLLWNKTISPYVHVFGHLHETGGYTTMLNFSKTTFVNASCVVNPNHGIKCHGYIYDWDTKTISLNV